MIPIYSNSLGEEEIKAISQVIQSKWLGRGEHCKNFENELATFWNAKNVLLVNNCTSALSLSLKALGVGPGDEVIISTINFLGCPNSVIELGAIPVFADVDPHTLNILPEEIERCKTSKTKAVYVLHYAGHPCDFDEIKKVCGDNIAIIEDSANSVASKYKGKYCGSLGDIGAFSFDAMKTLVMGDGGAMCIKNEDVYNKLESYRYLGFEQTTTSGSDALKKGNNRWWEFDLQYASGRYISNDLLASIGRVQLKKLPEFIKRRKEIWDYYQKELVNINGLEIPPEPLPNCSSSYYMYWIKVKKGRDDLASFLAKEGVYTTFRYFPLHMVSYYKSNASLPNAEAVNEETLNIPLHQNLSDDDLEKIVSSVKKFFS